MSHIKYKKKYTWPHILAWRPGVIIQRSAFIFIILIPSKIIAAYVSVPAGHLKQQGPSLIISFIEAMHIK